MVSITCRLSRELLSVATELVLLLLIPVAIVPLLLLTLELTLALALMMPALGGCIEVLRLSGGGGGKL